MIATLQIINTTPGSNERAMITIQYSTFETEVPRAAIELALKETADRLAMIVGMKSAARFPITWQENPNDQA